MKEHTSISAMVSFNEAGILQSIYMNAETDSDAATLSRALYQILKRPEDEMEDLSIRLKWLTAIIQVATLEAKLARLGG